MCRLDCPAVTEALSGVTPNAKSVTEICMSTEPENPTPLLLAATDTALVPAAQVMVDPGPVPQLPVQVSVFRPQPFGSVKPSCSPVRLAPKVLLASNDSVFDFPFHPGSVDCTVANASTRPAPKVLSAGVLTATAFPTSRLRTVV